MKSLKSLWGKLVLRLTLIKKTHLQSIYQRFLMGIDWNNVFFGVQTHNAARCLEKNIESK